MYIINNMERYLCNEQSTGASYCYRREIEQEILDSMPSHIVTSTHSGKIVRTAASILKLNLLECSLLGWLLRGSRYSLMELSVSATSITLFEEDQNKQLLLLILLNAYYAKNFLSPDIPPSLDS